jgi:malonate decarboxylase delta subunit
MEQHRYEFGPFRPLAQTAPALAGVVGSGNMEVMFEHAPSGGMLRFEVTTSIGGFDATWRAVLERFAERHRVGDLRVTINDAGATPAVVSLRLAQAAEELGL